MITAEPNFQATNACATCLAMYAQGVVRAAACPETERPQHLRRHRRHDRARHAVDAGRSAAIILIARVGGMQRAWIGESAPSVLASSELMDCHN